MTTIPHRNGIMFLQSLSHSPRCALICDGARAMDMLGLLCASLSVNKEELIHEHSPKF